ncbi:hypothetical protein CALCODRAFT_249433 [Calocera cornea HHB12733]|uniref:Uncharacterized protein n=1 Tax=Calocera cornea HHB12733 TaxID=1353952 RepID=A0A165JW90_9BASI|nr:hypothetical protein CALCODRAFT_249433 [Calocera cornea HHB12733]
MPGLWSTAGDWSAPPPGGAPGGVSAITPRRGVTGGAEPDPAVGVGGEKEAFMFCMWALVCSASSCETEVVSVLTRCESCFTSSALAVPCPSPVTPPTAGAGVPGAREPPSVGVVRLDALLLAELGGRKGLPAAAARLGLAPLLSGRERARRRDSLRFTSPSSRWISLLVYSFLTSRSRMSLRKGDALALLSNASSAVPKPGPVLERLFSGRAGGGEELLNSLAAVEGVEVDRLWLWLWPWLAAAEAERPGAMLLYFACCCCCCCCWWPFTCAPGASCIDSGVMPAERNGSPSAELLMNLPCGPLGFSPPRPFALPVPVPMPEKECAEPRGGRANPRGLLCAPRSTPAPGRAERPAAALNSSCSSRLRKLPMLEPERRFWAREPGTEGREGREGKGLSEEEEERPGGAVGAEGKKGAEEGFRLRAMWPGSAVGLWGGRDGEAVGRRGACADWGRPASKQPRSPTRERLVASGGCACSSQSAPCPLWSVGRSVGERQSLATQRDATARFLCTSACSEGRAGTGS